MIRTRLVAALLMAGACGTAPRPTTATAPASPPAPAPAPAPTAATETPPEAATTAAPAAIPGLDLKPGDRVVVERGGVYTYAGIYERDGKDLARFRQDDHSYWIEPDKAADAVRPLITTEEAERRLAILQDATVFDDRRPSQPRYTDRQRAIRTR
ncbi:MAG: hypothetical protein K8M05_36015 [Deltaproteobacteria bacterium]|nr:hypothetical protein [Kofleriaceae bacterium]